MEMTIQIYRIRGDWMRDGYIDNLDRRRMMEIAIVDGRAYATDMEGQPETRDPPLELDEDGAIRHVGAKGCGFFQPDDVEIARIGRDKFGGAV